MSKGSSAPYRNDSLEGVVFFEEDAAKITAISHRNKRNFMRNCIDFYSTFCFNPYFQKISKKK